MKRNYKFGIGACILLGAIGYLMYAGVQESARYYFTVEEFLPRQETMAGRGVRVSGRVTDGSLHRTTTARGTEMKFTLGDFTGDGQAAQAGTLYVEYTGVVPDMFAEGRDVIIEGTYADGVLQATTVMTSCPSKYEAEDEAGDAGAGRRAESN